MKRNPPWQRDELILALDFYFRYPPYSISQTHSELIELSEIFNRLPIHTERPDQGKFRNPNGVYMKLCNFLRFDPNYQGKGLSAGGKLEEVIWKQFSSDKTQLRQLAKLIAESVLENKAEIHDNYRVFTDEDEEDFFEGKVLYRRHRRRERNQSLVEKAREKRKKEVGKLRCDICNFDFSFTYGELGQDYIECHHTKPVSELEDKHKTRIEDLALVCSNCHRMLHRKRPWLSIEELKILCQNSISTL